MATTLDDHASHAVSPPERRSLAGRLLDWRPGAVARVLIVLLLVLPIMVATVYMWSMWDPSKKLRDVPLAIVNEDAGVLKDGKQENYGQEVADSLLGTDYLNFRQVSKQEASKGLLTGDYLFTVTIPETFSKNTITVIDPVPQRPGVVVSYNDYNGTNATMLTSGLVPQIQAGVAAALSENYAKQVLDGLNQLGDGIRAAEDGARQLDDGAGQLKDGTTQAKDGVSQLRDGAIQLDDGAAELKDGTGQLRDGAGQLNDGANQLVDGTGQLADGAGQIDDGVGQLTGALLPLLDSASQLANAVRPVVGQLRAVGLNAEADRLESSIAKLDANNPESTANQLRRLKDGTAEMHRQLSDPNAPYLNGVLRLRDGTVQLNDGAVQLDDGAGRLKDGTGQLRDGMEQLWDGTLQLDDGVARLKDGTGQLHGGLADGAARAPSVKNIPMSAQQIAVPVAFDDDFHHPVQTTVSVEDPTVKELSGGVSMLMVLVMGWMVMAIVAILAPYLIGRRTRHTRALGPVLKGFTAISAANLVVLLLMSLVSDLSGWSPVSVGHTALAVVMMALSGAAVYQFFRILLGRVIGTVSSLAFYALGVFSFGGVWPLDTMPGFLTWMHRLHPMTYARYAFIRGTDGIIDSAYWTGILGMLIITVVTLILSVFVRLARVKGQAEELQELVEHRERHSVAVGAEV